MRPNPRYNKFIVCRKLNMYPKTFIQCIQIRTWYFIPLGILLYLIYLHFKIFNFIKYPANKSTSVYTILTPGNKSCSNEEKGIMLFFETSLEFSAMPNVLRAPFFRDKDGAEVRQVILWYPSPDSRKTICLSMYTKVIQGSMLTARQSFFFEL